MLKTGIAGTALLMAAACSPETIETAPAAETANAPATGEVLTCAITEMVTGAMIPQLSTCEIPLGDGEPTLHVSSDMIANGEGALRIEVVDASGASRQVIEETATGTYSYPYSEDIDGDGAADIMVPVLTGNVNTNYALWLNGADGRFTRAGELSGVRIGQTPGGLIAASGRSSASEWETGYYRVTDGALEEVAAVVNRPAPDPGEPAAPACEVIRIVDGMDPAPFCETVQTDPG